MTKRRNLAALLVTVILLLASLAGSALAAAPATPFMGTLVADESYDTSGYPTMVVTAAGGGHATHLGNYTVTYHTSVDLLTNAASAVYAEFVAADGSILHAEAQGQATPIELPNLFRVVEQYTITGGTGRFVGAAGSFTLTRTVDLNTGATSGEIEGGIVRSQT